MGQAVVGGERQGWNPMCESRVVTSQPRLTEDKATLELGDDERMVFSVLSDLEGQHDVVGGGLAQGDIVQSEETTTARQRNKRNAKIVDQGVTDEIGFGAVVYEGECMERC